MPEEQRENKLHLIAFLNASVPVCAHTHYSASNSCWYSILNQLFLFSIFLWLVGIAACKMTSQIASWDTRFELGTKAALLMPFSPIVVAADENEQIRSKYYC
jgi:hypothetical protein